MAAWVDPESHASPGIIHTALAVGALCVAPLAVAARLVLPLDQVAVSTLGLRVAAALLFVAVALVARVLRSRIAPLAPGGDENAWWNAHLPLALIIWSAGEGAALLGSAFFVLAGDVLMLVLIAAGLVLLLLSRPSRLMAS